MVARIYESSNIFLMFLQLDAKHVAVITEKEADTDSCLCKLCISGILQYHQQSLNPHMHKLGPREPTLYIFGD